MHTRLASVVTILAAAALALPGCEAIDQASGGIADALAPPDAVTGARQLNLMSPEDSHRLGLEVEAAILDGSRSSGFAVDSDTATRGRLVGIAERIVSVSHRPDTPVTLHLIENPDWNACATEGGFLFVFRGLLDGPPFGLRSDDEIAAILAHEWAHVTCGHIAEQQAQTLFDRSMRRSALYAASFATSQEAEADRVGVLYASLAGYDPDAASRIWRRMVDAGGESSSIRRTHPMSSERAAATADLARLAQAYRVPGRTNPDALRVLGDNAVVPRAPTSTGFLALLDAALQFYGEKATTATAAAGRSAEAADLKADLRKAVQAHKAGDEATAMDGYGRVLERDPTNVSALFNAARIGARRGKPDAAFQLLDAAVTAGLADPRRLSSEADLVSLHKDPRWKQLLKRCREAAK